MTHALRRLAATSALLLLAHAPASAVTSTQSGWWTDAPLAAAPDVPDDGLLLQGGATVDEPAAYGAVSFTLAVDEEPGDLTLVVAADSATTPNASIAVCPLTEAFAPAHGAALADAPSFDCSDGVGASRADDGRTFTVDASGLARDGAIAVALLPTAFTDRIVLEAPTGASLSTTTSSAPAPPTSPVGRTGAARPSPSRPTVGATPAPASTSPPAGPTAPTPTTAPVTPAEYVPVETADARPADARPADGGSSERGLAFLSLVVVTGGLWLFGGAARPSDPAGAREAASSSLGGAQS